MKVHSYLQFSLMHYQLPLSTTTLTRPSYHHFCVHQIYWLVSYYQWLSLQNCLQIHWIRWNVKTHMIVFWCTSVASSQPVRSHPSAEELSQHFSKMNLVCNVATRTRLLPSIGCILQWGSSSESRQACSLELPAWSPVGTSQKQLRVHQKES